MMNIIIVVLNSLCAISTEMEEKKEKKRLKDLEYPKRCGNLACVRGKKPCLIYKEIKECYSRTWC